MSGFLGWAKLEEAKIRFRSEGPETGRRWLLHQLIVRGWHFDRIDSNGRPVLFPEDKLVEPAFLEALSKGDIHGGCLGARETPDGGRELVDCFAFTMYEDIRISVVAWRLPEPPGDLAKASTPQGGRDLRYHIEVGKEKLGLTVVSASGSLVDIDQSVEFIVSFLGLGEITKMIIMDFLNKQSSPGCSFSYRDTSDLPDPPAVIAGRVEKYRKRALS